MGNKLLLITAIVTFLFCSNICAYGQDDSVAKAKEMWEKVIAAKGGRDKLQSVTTLVVSTKSHNPYDKKEFSNSHYEELYVLPYKLWWYMDARPGFPLSIRQCDFGQEICYDSNFNDTDRPRSTQEASKRAGEINYDDTVFNNNYKDNFFRHQLLYLMETKWFRPNLTGFRMERIGWQKYPIVAVTLGKSKYEYVIDPKTFLPIRFLLWYRSEAEKEYKLMDGQFLEDYIDVAGIKFPQVIKRGRKTDTKTVYQVNVDYRKDLFNQPPRPTDNPDSWKPQKEN